MPIIRCKYEKKYIFNPKYILRAETKKSIILMKPNYIESSHLHVIHPVYAMILSFFNASELEETIKEIANFFNVKYEKVEKNILALVNNEERMIGSTRKNGVFPKNTIVEFDEKIMRKHHYVPEMFLCDEVDIKLDRLEFPSDIICNITMKCATNCIYCYADRKNHFTKSFSFDLQSRILDEAKENGVAAFKIIGGDFFMYKEWEKILNKMNQCGFIPCISTKMPLSEKDINIIKNLEIGSEPIQISLDTLIKDNLYKIAGQKDPYYEQIKKSFDLLEKYRITYIVNTVLTSINDTLEDIKSLEYFFSNKTYFLEWSIIPAKCSMYNERPYSVYKPAIGNINIINAYLSDIRDKKKYNYNIKSQGTSININQLTKDEKREIFEERMPCSGNLSSIYILPDGKVTICEELYWHPKFILGDINTQSIKEIWNSKKAKDLFYIKQNEFRTDSHCSKCEEFQKCRSYKHICWRDTILSYGRENWDYPDALCPYSPEIKNDIFL